LCIHIYLASSLYLEAAGAVRPRCRAPSNLVCGLPLASRRVETMPRPSCSACYCVCAWPSASRCTPPRYRVAFYGQLPLLHLLQSIWSCCTLTATLCVGFIRAASSSASDSWLAASSLQAPGQPCLPSDMSCFHALFRRPCPTNSFIGAASIYPS